MTSYLKSKPRSLNFFRLNEALATSSLPGNIQFCHGRIFKHIPHLDYPYLIPHFVRNYYHILKEILCYLWYLFEAYTITFIFDIPRLFVYLNQYLINPALTHDQARLMKWLQWFNPITIWQQMLQVHHAKYAIITFKNHMDIIRDNEEEHKFEVGAEFLKLLSYFLDLKIDAYNVELVGLLGPISRLVWFNWS